MAARISRDLAWKSAFREDARMGSWIRMTHPARLVPALQVWQAFLAEFG
jgi:hypothetical protein